MRSPLGATECYCEGAAVCIAVFLVSILYFAFFIMFFHAVVTNGISSTTECHLIVPTLGLVILE